MNKYNGEFDPYLLGEGLVREAFFEPIAGECTEEQHYYDLLDKLKRGEQVKKAVFASNIPFYRKKMDVVKDKFVHLLYSSNKASLKMSTIVYFESCINLFADQYLTINSLEKIYKEVPPEAIDAFVLAVHECAEEGLFSEEEMIAVENQISLLLKVTDQDFIAELEIGACDGEYASSFYNYLNEKYPDFGECREDIYLKNRGRRNRSLEGEGYSANENNSNHVDAVGGNDIPSQNAPREDGQEPPVM